MNRTQIEAAVRDVIYRACLHQDDLEWEAWLALCADDFAYQIRAYSPEIQGDMIYLGGDRDAMLNMTQMLPKHNTDHSPLKRHCVVYQVQVADDLKSASAVSSLAVYQTQLDGINSHIDAGETRLFLAGRYHDEFRVDGDAVQFTARSVRLDTRRLDKGSHWPI